MKKVIETYVRNQVDLIEETLTDGSKVYNVLIMKTAEIPCVSLTHALNLIDSIKRNSV